MPWSNQGGTGGPWGSPGNTPNPWNRGSSGGPTPPDLEAILRRGQDRVRRALPQGFGGGRGLLLILLAILLLWLATGIYRVQEGQRGVVLRFGEYSRITEPGLHYHLPTPIESVLRPAVTRINRIDIGFVSAGTAGTGAQRDIPDESLMLTGDENIIDIDFTILWRISQEANGPRDFLFNIRDPAETVKIVAESAMREIIGRTEIQPALTEARADIQLATRELMQTTLDAYEAGIEVVEVQLQSVDPPQQVVDAFNDVLRARQDAQRVRNEAEAYRNGIIPVARGEAARIIQEAEAYRDQVVAAAAGDAQRFLSVLTSYSAAPDVTARRLYLETLEQVLQGVNKVIIDAETTGQGVVPYLPLNQLQPQVIQPRTGLGGQ